MRSTFMRYPDAGFTLVEILICLLILAILAMAAIPRLVDASNDTRETALVTDLQAARTQIQLYRSRHRGRGPEFNEGGAMDTANFVARMTSRTDVNGALNPKGEYGPYLPAWPSNPFVEGPAAQAIQFNSNARPPRQGETGWYYSLSTGMLYANSTKGGEEYDPLP
jgi:prepilin-type N-terminal cleavage/methylation domain-containing protein